MTCGATASVGRSNRQNRHWGSQLRKGNLKRRLIGGQNLSRTVREASTLVNTPTHCEPEKSAGLLVQKLLVTISQQVRPFLVGLLRKSPLMSYQ
jgi:hypothetical protein